jgi:geranylgeranyl diphosphate synthase type I
MAPPQTSSPAELLALRTRIDRTLDSFLADMREEMASIAAGALLPVDEVIRLIGAGGKRLRPTFCYWGYRAVGGSDGRPIERAASALELLHTMALIHDDLMDRSPVRRGTPSSALQLADRARRHGSTDPERDGTSLALLAGDLAAVLADRLFLTSGFEPTRVVSALDRYHRMRTDMALGQCLDLVNAGADPEAAALKGGSYTVEGPLLIGTALAGGGTAAAAALSAYGAPLGLAFQLLDDERDGEATPGAGRIDALVAQARAALGERGLDAGAVDALLTLADLIAAG